MYLSLTSVIGLLAAYQQSFWLDAHITEPHAKRTSELVTAIMRGPADRHAHGSGAGV